MSLINNNDFYTHKKTHEVFNYTATLQDTMMFCDEFGEYVKMSKQLVAKWLIPFGSSSTDKKQATRLLLDNGAIITTTFSIPLENERFADNIGVRHILAKHPEYETAIVLKQASKKEATQC
ncbi:MAG: hypothetical protein RR490_00435 [Niameybacter sp.]